MMKINLMFWNILNFKYQLSFFKHIKYYYSNSKSSNSNLKNNLIPSSNISKNEEKVMLSRKEIKKIIDDKENIIKKPIKSSGPGGQHVNKTQSAIFLQDKQTNISVKVGNSRDSVVNAGIAKKRLVDKLDHHYNGADSKIAKKIEKIRKQKSRSRRKSENKYNPVKENREPNQ